MGSDRVGMTHTVVDCGRLSTGRSLVCVPIQCLHVATGAHMYGDSTGM